MVVENLQGININKQFMPSVANTVGVDLSKYKVVSKCQFAFNPMHVGRDEMLPISMLDKDDPVIVSPAYVVFEIKDHDELDPEYLMMWCRRPEFDRNAWFTTDSSVRGGFSWSDFCDMELPVPSIEKQREIVREYNTIVNSIQLNEKMNQKLEETAQAIYKHWFVDFEFPISAEYAASIGKPELKGKPYKSSGGEMAFCAELDQEIPKNWRSGTLEDLLVLQRGFDLPIQKRTAGIHPIYAANGIAGYHQEFKVHAPGIVTGRSGSLGEVFYIQKDFWPLNTTLWIKDFKHSQPIFSYFTLKAINLMEFNSGSAVPTLNRNYVHMHAMCIPPSEIILKFENYAEKIFVFKGRTVDSLNSLEELKSILLAKTSLEAKAA